MLVLVCFYAFGFIAYTCFICLWVLGVLACRFVDLGGYVCFGLFVVGFGLTGGFWSYRCCRLVWICGVVNLMRVVCRFDGSVVLVFATVVFDRLLVAVLAWIVCD